MKKVWQVILGVYVLGLTMRHFVFQHHLQESAINLVPFQTISKYVLHSDRFNNDIIFTNLVMRPLIFVVLGVLVALAFNHLSLKKCWQSVAVVLVAFVLIESMQYILKLGYFDIDAIILAVSGYCVGLFVSNTLLKRLKIG